MSSKDYSLRTVIAGYAPPVDQLTQADLLAFIAFNKEDEPCVSSARDFDEAMNCIHRNRLDYQQEPEIYLERLLGRSNSLERKVYNGMAKKYLEVAQRLLLPPVNEEVVKKVSDTPNENNQSQFYKEVFAIEEGSRHCFGLLYKLERESQSGEKGAKLLKNAQCVE